MKIHSSISSMLVLILVFASVSCKKDEGVNVALNNEVNEFVWQGMRGYYFWQADVPDLDDGRFTTFDELHTFLNSFGSPQSLFDHFTFRDDRFSWIVDDFEALDESFQGISKSFGYEFGLVRIGNTERIFGYVQYVLPGSPAEEAGLVRGNLFDTVNGATLTDSNFQALLFGQETYTLSLGDFLSREEGLGDNGNEVTMTAVTLTENPVLLAEVVEFEGIKIGYLVYNQFISTFRSALNQAMGELKSQGVTEMVLDLRYNPGGSVRTSQILASMLYDDATASDVFARISFNSRLSELDGDLFFQEEVEIVDANDNLIGSETMNRLDLSRLFVLTSSGTASASESVITGLSPYLEVIQIGDVTVGKNVGSVTLYDSPEDGYLESENANPNHKYAMQPIISQLANSEGFTNYTEGLIPSVQLNELDYLENLAPLGNVDEPLLAAALGIIAGTARVVDRPHLNLERVFNSKEQRPHLYQMLHEPADIPHVLLR